MPNRSQQKVDSLPLGQRQRLLLRLLRLRSGRQLRRVLTRLHPSDIATLFPLLKPDERLRLIEVLFEMRLAAPTLRELDDEDLQQVLDEFSDSRLAIVLTRLSADDAVDLLFQLEPSRRDTLLGALEPALSARLTNLMVYGQQTAGGIMDPDVVFFRGGQSVAETLEVIRQLAETRRLYYLYVVDDRGHLIGLVKLWQLVSSRSDQLLREVMSREVISLQVEERREEVARLFSRYDLPIMPVLDRDGLLVGVITVDDVIDVIEEEASEDLYRLGGLPEPEGLSSSINRSLRLRLPAFALGVAGACLAAWIIASFENLLARFAILAAFMHLVGATGGTAARQTLTIVTASLAPGTKDLFRTRRVIARQTLIGTILGILSGSALALLAWIWERQLSLVLAVFIAQVVSQAMAALTACLIPLFLRRVGRDPALGSATVTVFLADITGFGCFLVLAASFLER